MFASIAGTATVLRATQCSEDTALIPSSSGNEWSSLHIRWDVLAEGEVDLNRLQKTGHIYSVVRFARVQQCAP